MPRGDITEEVEKKIEQVLTDLRSQNPKVRIAADLEVKKLTHLYGRDALMAVEEILAERAYERQQEEAWSMGGPGIVWD